MHSAKRLVNMSTRALRHQSASARVGMFASRCPFSQLSKNQVLLHLERSDWFCIIPCGRRCRACGTFPSSYRSSAHLAATMGSSDSCDSFRPAGLPSSRQNFPDTPPFYAPPCFPRQKSSLALLFGFTHYETLAAWVVGVTGRNSEGSLALRLIRLYDRASTVESPLPWPVILSDRRFLIRVNTFQFTSSAKFAWRTIIPPSAALSVSLLGLWSRAFRLGFADSEAPSSNRTCGFPAYGFPCETVVIGSISFS